MGLSEKVTLTLVIIIIIQIACRHCMPRTSSKSAYKPYLNLKSIKNKSSTPFSLSRFNKTPNPTFGKKNQNAKIRQNPPTKKSLYEAYNFPETEYPLDNSPSDSIYFGTNINKKNQFNRPQEECCNLKKSAIDNLKRDLKMKRKLTSNKKIYMESPKKDMTSVTTFASGPKSIRLMETGPFPEVQYPLNAMDIWAPNYWYPLPFTQEEQKYDVGELQPFKLNVSEDGKTPFVKLTRAKANKYLQSYDKLKEEKRRTSTLSSKRSNAGNTAFNFVKTATSEKHSDDFISSSMITSIPNNSSDTTKTVMQKTEIPSSLDNICPVTEYDYKLVPIPYKVIEQDTENISQLICPAYELNSTKVNVLNTENETERATINKTQLVHTNTLTDDIISTGSKILSPESVSTATDKISQQQSLEMNIPEYTFTNGPSKEVITLTPIDRVNNFSDEPIVEPPTPVSDDSLSDFLQNDMPVSTVHENPENTLNAIPVPLTGPLPVIVPSNVSSPQTILAQLSNHNTVSSTSIIIIPINNADGKSQPHIIETVGDAPIILYIPGSHNEHTTKSVPNHQPLTLVKSISNNLDFNIPDVGIPEVPNNTTYTSYNMVTRFSENPSQSVLVNKIPLIKGTSRKHFTNTESQFSKHETLPLNSMCYNNENNPLSLREEPPFNKSVLDTSPDSQCDKSKFDDSNIELPLFNFTGSDSTLPSTQTSDTTIENVPIPMDSSTLPSPLPGTLSDSTNNWPPMVDKTVPLTQISDPPNIQTSPIEKTILPTQDSNPPIDAILPLDKMIVSIPFLDTPTATLALPIDKTFPPTPFSETLIDRATILEKTLSLTLISDPPNIVTTPVEKTFPLTPHSDFLTDEPLPLDKALTSTPHLDISTESLPLPLDKTLPPSSVSATPTDTLLMPDKTPYILASSKENKVSSTPLSKFSTDGPFSQDKTLTSTPHFDPPTDTLPLPMDKTLSPTPLLKTPTEKLSILAKTYPPTLVYDSPSILPSPIEKTIPPTPLSDFPTDRPLPLDNTIAFTSVLDSPIDTLPLLMDKTLPPTPLLETPTDQHSILDKTNLPTPISDSPSILPTRIEKIVPPTPLFDFSTDRPLPLDNTIASTPVLDSPTDTLPLLIDKTLPPNPLSESPTDRLPILDKTDPNTPISDLPSILSSPIENITLPTPLTDLPTDVPLLLDNAILPTPFPDSPTDTIPLPMDNTLPPIPLSETPIDRLSILDKTDPPTPISDPPCILSSPIEKLVPPTPLSDHLTVGSLPLHKMPTSVSLLDSSDNLPLSIGTTTPATALSELPTNRPPMLEETLAPTPISDPFRILSSPIENTIPSTPLTALTTNGPVLLDKTILFTTLLDLPTDTLPLLINKTLSPTPLSETPTDRLSRLSKTYPPISISDCPSILPSPIESIVPPTPLSDIPTDELLLLDKTLTSTPLLDTPDNLPLSIDKTPPATALSESATNRPPMLEETLAPTPISDPFSILPSPIENLTLPTPLTDLPTDVPLPLDKTIPSTPLLDPLTDTLPLLNEKTLPPTPLSETPIDRLPILGKTYPPTPISDSISIIPSPIENTVSATLLSDFPIDRPSPLDNTIASTPVLDSPTDALPLPMDKTIPLTPLSETPTDRLPILDMTYLPTLISNPFNNLPSLVENTVPLMPLSEFPTNGPLPLEKTLTPNPLLGPPTDTLPLQIEKTLPPTPLSETPTEILPILDKTYPPTPISNPLNNLPSLAENTVPPMPLPDIPTNGPLPLDKTITSIALFGPPTDSLPLPMDMTLPLTLLSKTPTNLPSMFDEAHSPLPISVPSNFIPWTMEKTSTPLSDPAPMENTLPPSPLLETPRDRLVMLDKTLSLTPISDSPPIEKTVPTTVLSDPPIDGPLPVDRTLTSTPLDPPSDSPPLTMGKMFSPTSILDTPIDKLPMLKEKTLSHTPTSNIVPSPVESLLMDDLPLPVDRVFQDISVTEISTDKQVFSILDEDLSLPSLPFSEFSKHATDLPVLMNYLPVADLSPIPLSEVQVHDIPPEVEVHINTPIRNVPKDSMPTSMDGFPLQMSEIIQDNPVSYIPTNDLPHSLVVGETPQKTDFFDISSTDLPSPINLPPPINKALPDIPFTDLGSTDLALLNYNLPLPVDKDTTLVYMQKFDNSLPLSADGLPTDIPSDHLPLPVQSGLSHNPADSIPLSLDIGPDTPESSILSVDKVLSDSKLPITKALLEKVFSEIIQGGLTLLEENIPPGSSLSILPTKKLPIDVTLLNEPFSGITRDGPQIPLKHWLPELPLSDMTEKSLPLPVHEVLTDTTLSDKTVNKLPISRIAENYLLFPEFEIPIDELPSPIEIMRPDLTDILTSDDDKVKNAKFSDNPTDDLPLLLHKKLPPLQIMPDSQQLTMNKELSASELSITKTLLENVLSEISKRGLSVPKSPATSLSKIFLKDLQEVKPIFDDLPLSMDNPFPENEVPDNTGLPKDTIIQMNPISNILTDSLPSTDTLLRDNGLSETPTDNNLGQ